MTHDQGLCRGMLEDAHARTEIIRRERNQALSQCGRLRDRVAKLEAELAEVKSLVERPLIPEGK